jgi:thymidine kinase
MDEQSEQFIIKNINDGRKHGVLNLKTGPMFAGKTSMLIRICEILRGLSITFEVYKHSDDVRNNRPDTICSHNNETHLCKSSYNLCEFLNTPDYDKAQVLIIEEIQFFDANILTFLDTALNRDKKLIIAAGLNSTFEMEQFPHMGAIMARCERIDHLTAYCHFCDDINAPFTVKISGTTNEKEVGSDMYKPCCRKHYNEEIVKFKKMKEDEKRFVLVGDPTETDKCSGRVEVHCTGVYYGDPWSGLGGMEFQS